MKISEDEYDALVADAILDEFEKSGEIAQPIEKLAEELGFADLLISGS